MTGLRDPTTKAGFVYALWHLSAMGRPPFTPPTRLPPLSLCATSVSLACANWRHPERVPDGWWAARLAAR
jgi:hypothetical protein